MRFLRLILTCICITALLLPHDAAAQNKKTRAKRSAPVASGVNDPRYAALIMNPKTGEVYHEKDADARRYPASLTKMMTLYLLFEALENDKLSLRSKLQVSSYAATMPQTNLSLSPGDEIPVETAIKALVVRSANDVSVVVAEALGGDVENFASMMTSKARQLGMKGTQFANPNGLPNSQQYTTARDMAKLGIALKRDFPQYYGYFSVREFSWAGTSYYTHNRVMLRYAGVDGIKTGFIGASGFNLVTSSNRGGRPLIGVVLGGGSGRWRDDRMITLLNEAYTIVASRGATRGKMAPGNLPNSRDGVEPVVEAPTAPAPDEAQPESATEPTSTPKPAPATPATTSNASPAANLPAPSPFKPTVTPQTPVVATSGSPASPATTPPPAPISSPTPFKSAGNTLPVKETNWGIQVGAFSSKKQATTAGKKALSIAASHLKGAKIVITSPKKGESAMHRVRIEQVTEYQATRACEALSSSNIPCFTYSTDLPTD